MADSSSSSVAMDHSMPNIPSLGLGKVPNASLSAGGGLGSDRPLSTRRLKKELLCADSANNEVSNSAGHVTLADSSGTPRSVRVVQQQELEDFNMVNVKWVWSFEGNTHQVGLPRSRLLRKSATLSWVFYPGALLLCFAV